jgi:hypothetical protein
LAVPAALIPLLFLDGAVMATHFRYGQWLFDGIILAFFGWMLTWVSRRLRMAMLIGIGVGALGEVFFSLVVGMYDYRLANVPIYIPLGHSIIYATIFLLVREHWMRCHARLITLAGYGLCLAFSLVWLVMYRDVFGFICFAAFSVLIYFKRELRLFFVCIFIIVSYLELWGTYFQCWHWPSTLMNHWPAVPSANPPSGISVFYMGFDIACLSLYKRSIPNLRARLLRLRAVRQARIDGAAGTSVQF